MSKARNGRVQLDPSGIDHIVLIGDCRTVIGRQKQNQARHFFRENHSFQRLIRQYLGLVFFGEPQPLLPLGKDRSGHDAIHADIVTAEFV